MPSSASDALVSARRGRASRGRGRSRRRAPSSRSRSWPATCRPSIRTSPSTRDSSAGNSPYCHSSPLRRLVLHAAQALALEALVASTPRRPTASTAAGVRDSRATASATASRRRCGTAAARTRRRAGSASAATRLMARDRSKPYARSTRAMRTSYESYQRARPSRWAAGCSALRLPRGDALLALPVADGDAEPVGASGVEAEESGLLGGELEHPVGGLGVAVAGLLVAPRGEDHGVVRRRGRRRRAGIGPFWPPGATRRRLAATISDS